MQISIWDIVIIIAYMALIAIVGIVSKKKVKNTKDYYVAGRSLPTFMLVATICASVVGGSALIGKGGYAYSGGGSLHCNRTSIHGRYVFIFSV